MPLFLACPQGHQWEWPADTPFPSGGETPPCPVCGSLASTAPALAAADSGRTSADSSDYPAIPGYEILGELGHGGMGVVYRARQVALKRLVALKMIRSGASPGPEQVARFKSEAEAAARLQHPNIVQVHEVGEQQGQPFLALEFVEGGTLAARTAGAPQPSRPAAAVVEVLARAVHYAHARGIVHRDLKPANILLKVESRRRVERREAGVESQRPLALGSRLSALGSPMIADFGLAKLIDAEESHTQSGAIVGTPSYMAPEQAWGKSRARVVGPAADVWALGAILYELLTGRPPFRGETPLDTLEQVVSQEPVPVRRLQPKVPRDLETICLKCLEKEPRKRYASAAALADDLDRFLEGKPVLARPVGAAGRLWRWARRNRPLAAALAALAAVLVVGLVSVTLLWLHAEERREQAEKEYLRAERNADAARKNAQAEEVQRERAEDRLQKAMAAVDTMLTQVSEEWLPHVPQTEPVRRALLQKAVALYRGFLDEKSKDPRVRQATGRTYYRVADLLSRLGDDRGAEQAYRDAVTLFEALAGEFPGRPEYRRDLAAAQTNLATRLRSTNRTAASRRAYERGVALYRQLVKEFPQDRSYRRELATSLSQFGTLLTRTGQDVAAREALLEALELRMRLADEQPKLYASRYYLALSCRDLGKLEEKAGKPAAARESYGDAVKLLRELTAAFPENPEPRDKLARCLGDLAALSLKGGRPAEAADLYREALALGQQLTRDFPSRPDFREQLALSGINRGVTLSQLGDGNGAISAYEQARALLEELVERYPRRAGYRGQLAIAHNNTAFLLGNRGQQPEAIAHYRKSLALRRQLAEVLPNDPRYGPSFRSTWLALTDLLLKSGDHAEAAQVAGELPAVFPDVPAESVRAAAVVARCLPLAEKDDRLDEAGRREAARAYGERAIALLRAAVERGYRAAATLRADAAFAPLHGRPEFQEILRRAEKN